jgi:hypothetical protein
MIKHVLRYIVGSNNIGIEFLKSSDQGLQLVGWANVDYGTFLATKKSMLGYVICFYGNPISWTTKKQPVVVQSTTEAELIAINKCAKQLRWMSNLITTLDIKIEVPVIYNNNSGAALPALTGRTRQFEHRSSSRVRPVNAGSAVIISQEAQLNPNTKHIEIRFQYFASSLV